jgi:hypothetical protein
MHGELALQVRAQREPADAVASNGYVMKTFPAATLASKHVAFEISNLLVSRRQIAKLISALPGVTRVVLGAHFGSSSDLRLTFDYYGEEYIVWEPYGDSSRYWIGPRTLTDSSRDCSELEAAFQRFEPSLLVRGIHALLGSISRSRRARDKKGSA